MSSRRKLANAIRFLSMDAVQKANSGHPGMPMGMADIAEVLWNDFLRHNPNNPQWSNRDRFIISNGHGSMLLYSLLHLTGYQDMTIEQIKNFRQLHSITAGHPEYGLATGIETTTGPLGQGIANGVGMAIAERTLAAQFNRPHLPIVDHYTYVFLGDGCLMEGLSHECCSLAGHLGLGKLIAFWDDNAISIDGKVAGWFTDDTPMRFTAYGWHVIANVDGHNSNAIRNAILEAQSVTNKPSLICCKTTIGFGSPNMGGSHKAHGAALGEEECKLVRKELDWPYPPFEIPQEIYQAWDAREKGQALENEWTALFANYQKQFPDLALEFKRRIEGLLPNQWQQEIKNLISICYRDNVEMATRKASQKCLNLFGPLLPELLGGSADLTDSNLTHWSDSKTITHTSHNGNYIYYGVREFGMFAIMNGMALHGGFIPYGGTFLTFVDYGRNAVRLAALMKQRVIFVLTHDSIGLGEDGPTHQPVEHISILRLTPGLSVWRPCDLVESFVAWKYALEHHHQPTALLFSRQNLPAQSHSEDQMELIARGGYILIDSYPKPDAIVIATGSEVHLAVGAYNELKKEGINIRVVSMPSTTTFDQQSEGYQNQVLPKNIKARIAIEAASSDFWYKYVGDEGKIIGLDRYGESAPGKDVFKYLGFTVENVVKIVKSCVQSN